MAEFGNGRKNRIPVSREDIKKAIKSANHRLTKANDKLDEAVSVKKKSLTSMDKEISSYKKGLKSIGAEIESAKHDAVRAKAEASKERAKLSKLKKQVSEAVSSEDKAQSSLINLTKESALLDKNISKMKSDLAIASTLKEEIKILKADKKLESKELDKIGGESGNIKKELSQLRTDSTKKKKVYKELLNKLDAEAEVKQKLLDEVDNKYIIKLAELNTRFSSLKESFDDKEQEVETMDSLIKQKEKEFIDWESKCRQAEYLLVQAKELADSQIERSKKEINRQQEAAKRWKIGFFEEIARVKLKKKIENIDMAGLKEAFDV